LKFYQLLAGGWKRIAESDHAYCLFWVDHLSALNETNALWEAKESYVAGQGDLQAVRDAFRAWEAKLIEIDVDVFSLKSAKANKPKIDNLERRQLELIKWTNGTTTSAWRGRF
jgi:hypothetical protein